MKKLILLIPFIAICAPTLEAQWDTITSFDQKILDLQTFDSKLFIGGSFWENEGKTCNWSAYYNGNNITRHTQTIGGGGIRAMDVFEDELFAVGSMQHGSSIGVSKWDGSTWVDGGSTSYSHSTIYADDNDLYVVDDFGKIRKKTSGGSFQTFYDFDDVGDVYSVIRYNDHLIFAGSFDTINGMEVNNIAAWDGATWLSLGNGVSKGVSSMAVMNNELYVAGIDQAGGQIVNGIAKWDGANWSDVGGGITGTGLNGIRDMVAFHGILYVVGDFNEMGSVATHDVAQWDGSEWSTMSLGHSDDFVSCVAIYDNQLYVGTYDFDTSHVFVYDGTIANIPEAGVVTTFKVYPNPANDQLQVELSRKNRVPINLEMVDIMGNTVLSQSISTNGRAPISLDCSHLTAGTYHLVVREEGTQFVLKQQRIVVY